MSLVEAAQIVDTTPVQYIEGSAVTVAAAAPAITVAAQAVTAAPAVAVIDNRWADYSPEEVQLGAPELPAADYRCYQPPTVPPGQTRYLKVDEPTSLKNLEQNFNDVRTAVRENNTHIQRNKTNITNINRNHNHLLRIVTNENNYNHFLTNNVVRVADIHRQRIENLKGETRNFKDFKATQRVEAAGCRRDGIVQVAAVPTVAAAPVVAAAPAVTVRQVASPAQIQVMAPATPTPVRYVGTVATPAQTIRSARSVLLQ